MISLTKENSLDNTYLGLLPGHVLSAVAFHLPHNPSAF